ncbi:MAG: phage associated protein [Massilia sp.]|nr:phage associated protein [Massilia sp.]
MSAVAGVALIYHNAAQARIRATIDLIIHQKGDAELLKCIETVYKLSDGKVRFSQYLADTESSERRCILKVLNNHEFIATGIRTKAFDEKIYKLMQCSNVMKVWDSSRGIVNEIRTLECKDTLFQEFEWLAERWKESPVQKNKR